MRHYSTNRIRNASATTAAPHTKRHKERTTMSGKSCKHRHRPLFTGIVVVALLALAGCDMQGGTLFIDTSFLNGLLGWDLSACGSGFNTCLELVSDNQNQLLGGSSINDTLNSAVTGLLDNGFD